jgi:hypothetical protein
MRAAARRSPLLARIVAAFVVLSMLLSSFGRPRMALADADGIALYVEGPEAQAVRAVLLDALPSGIQRADEKDFHAELKREGQVRPLGKDVDPAVIDRVRRAARVMGVAAALVVRTRRDHKAIRALVMVVPAWTSPTTTEETTLDFKSHDDDVAAIASALGSSLEPYVPRPAAPSPSVQSPPPSPQADQGEGAAAKPAAEPPVAPELPSTPIVSIDVGQPAPRPRWSPAQRAASSLVELTAAGGIVGRRYQYASGIQPGTMRFTLSPAPQVSFGAQVYPLARASGVWRDIGLVGTYARIFSVMSDTDSLGADLFPSSYSAGLRARIHPGADPRLILGLSLEYTFVSRRQVGPSGSELPDVVYKTLRPGVDTRVHWGRFSLIESVGFHALLDNDTISPRFYRPHGYGLDVEFGAALAIQRALEARLLGNYELYSFGFTPPPGATFGSGSARDQLYGGRLEIAFTL